ncbi:Metalloregulation DNA-binding stress protein [Fusobacterium necrogenes]|uniref:Metalloregulation DNA-binding stress protein n=1 Tax=Fusobacterium necrogenes TaxID=858 RepID=A0A377GVE0_9FUSO|nr:DNA starvation/stationary phase protection protein [Fusobacterium necrogenes]STO30945.1 Metalloregulation DNA-binding stress protein [Fusobacterium necrogenes]
MEKKLNVLLSDLVVEYHKLQNFHWYVKGKSFFQLHSKLEELYNGINKSIDEVAESILIIGGKPLGSLKEFSANSKIKEEENKYVSGEYILKEISSDFEYFLKVIKEIKLEADEKNEYIVSALMDDLIKEFAKGIWMLKQSME